MLEQILYTALSDTFNSAIPNTETDISGKHLSCNIHDQTIFRMVSGTKSRANLKPNLSNKPTLSYVICNWQRSMCRSCVELSQYGSSLQLPDRSLLSLIHFNIAIHFFFRAGEYISSNSIFNGLTLNNKSFISLKNTCLKFSAEEQSHVWWMELFTYNSNEFNLHTIQMKLKFLMANLKSTKIPVLCC